MPRLLIAAQEARSHHRRQCQRHESRYGDAHGGGDRELAEQSADDAAEQQQRDEHGHQGDADRNDREGDLGGTFHRRLVRLHAVLDVAHDVFQHDNRVVDHEADGNRQRHQRDVVEAVAHQIHERARTQ